MNKDIRKQENQFAPFIQKVIKDNLNLLPDDFFNIKQSTDEEDTKLSFDLYFKGDIQVSVRLRNYKYNYKDITIRSRSKLGRSTEIDKLSNGLGQIYFYGWLDISEEQITRWILIDIDKIRDKLFDNGIEYHNNDGSRLKAYDFKFLKENNSIINYSKNN
jgi:hypothetical protein